MFTGKCSLFTVYTFLKAVPRNPFEEPPNNPCGNHYSSRTAQSLREASQLCFFYSHMLSIWNTQWLPQVCTCVRKMFNLFLKNLQSRQTAVCSCKVQWPQTSPSKHSIYLSSSRLGTQAGPRGHCILPSHGSDHRGGERISPTSPNSGVPGEWQKQENKALSFSWVEAIWIWGSNRQNNHPLLGPGKGHEPTVKL